MKTYTTEAVISKLAKQILDDPSATKKLIDAVVSDDMPITVTVRHTKYVVTTTETTP